MQIFESTKDPFRYPMPWPREKVVYGGFLTGVRVASMYLDPALVNVSKGVERLQAELRSSESHLAFEEYGEHPSGRVANVLRPHLREHIGLPSMRYLSAGLGVFKGGAESYHHDSPMVGCIFGAWHLGGPDREVRFPELGLVVPFTRGTLLLFDQMQPHAMLRPGAQVYDKADYVTETDVVMLSISVSKKPKVRQLLGIQEYRPTKHRHIRQPPAEYRVCPATGRIDGMP